MSDDADNRTGGGTATIDDASAPDPERFDDDDLACLESFEKRMDFIAFFAQLAFQTGTQSAWKDAGFGLDQTGQQDQFTVLMMVMLFIMQRSINDEICTKDDIADFLSATDQRIWRHHLTDRQCADLATFIVDAVLTNNGRPMTFRTYSSARDGLVERPVQLVESRYWQPNSQNDTRVTYRMTQTGYHCLFASLELEDSVNVNLQNLILEYQLRHGDYERALDRVRKIDQLLKTIEQKIDDDIHAIRQDVASYHANRYEATINETYDAIDETNHKFREYTDYADSQRRALQQSAGETRVRLDDAAMRQLSNLGGIMRGLKRGMESQSRILKRKQDMSREYDIALREALVSSARDVHHYPFPAAVYGPMLDDASVLETAAGFLAPLFSTNLRSNQTFNPAKAFLPQERDEEQEAATRLVANVDEDAWAQEEKEAQEERARDQEVMDALLTGLIGCAEEGEDGTVRATLGGLAQRAENDAAYAERLMPDARRFTTVLAEFLWHDPYNVEQIKESMALTVRDEWRFDVTRSLAGSVEGDAALRGVSAITIDTLPGTVVFRKPAATGDEDADGSPVPVARCTDCAVTFTLSGAEAARGRRVAVEGDAAGAAKKTTGETNMKGHAGNGRDI